MKKIGTIKDKDTGHESDIIEQDDGRFPPRD